METVKLEAGFCSSSTNLGDTSLKLPDATQLLASFDSVKESLAVNVGGSSFTSTKRSDLNGSVDGPRKKIPKGNLIPPRNLPDTAGGLLLPPQLRGRSNVATEDLDKLFTKRQRARES
ncbi:hypothetical protein GOP47_0012562 [Adiantum capillus-veneris]|nr:hypothetical protein GOP47_0012562 [Adiantum capillus-veneris]